MIFPSAGKTRATVAGGRVAARMVGGWLCEMCVGIDAQAPPSGSGRQLTHLPEFTPGTQCVRTVTDVYNIEPKPFTKTQNK